MGLQLFTGARTEFCDPLEISDVFGWDSSSNDVDLIISIGTPSLSRHLIRTLVFLLVYFQRLTISVHTRPWSRGSYWRWEFPKHGPVCGLVFVIALNLSGIAFVRLIEDEWVEIYIHSLRH